MRSAFYFVLIIWWSEVNYWYDEAVGIWTLHAICVCKYRNVKSKAVGKVREQPKAKGVAVKNIDLLHVNI